MKRGYTVNFAHNATVAAATPLQMLAAAANVRGVIARKLGFVSHNNAAFYTSPVIIAKATAPANTADGIIIGATQAALVNGANLVLMHDSEPDIFVPAGLAIYFFCPSSELSGLHHGLFEVL